MGLPNRVSRPFITDIDILPTADHHESEAWGSWTCPAHPEITFWLSDYMGRIWDNPEQAYEWSRSGFIDDMQNHYKDSQTLVCGSTCAFAANIGYYTT